MKTAMAILKRLIEILRKRGTLSRETADYIWNGDGQDTE